MIEGFVTVREAAELKQCSVQTVINWIRQGRVRAERLGKMYIIPRGDLEQIELSRRGRPSRSVIRQIVREEVERAIEERLGTGRV